MTRNIITHEFKVNNQTITLETGKLARQADGAVVLRCGDTILLATAVSSTEAKEGIDFLPLTVDYREKFSAAGRFPGGFLKRETRPSDHEILIMRLIDRALRPLFPDDYHAETQVMISLNSLDKEIAPDALVCLAASAALLVSDIPFKIPVSEVRVARVNGEYIINPLTSQLANADIDMIVAGSENSIVMVEGEMSEVSEAEMLKAIKVAHDAIKIQCEAQKELARKVGTLETYREYEHERNDASFYDKVHAFCYDKAFEIAAQGNPVKAKRKEAFKAIKEEFQLSLTEEELETNQDLISKYYHDVEKKAVRDSLLTKGIRLDGRSYTEIRPIWCEVDCLPSPHGSALFTRGETQSLTTITMGSKLDEQMIDGAFFEGSERFILHYNFPPFSTGEAKPIRGTSRREVGHGNLALRALKKVMPADIPYTIRIVSDILESNGSSSMATVCAGTLALMDAGIKIKRPVAGIAMGLITDGKDKFAVLSDILGDEDHLGDMDFKVTGTSEGITACQMDIKIEGLSYEILETALEQARQGRLHILGKMMEVMNTPREAYKSHVPQIEQVKIPKEFIGAIIGPGGKIIQEMQKSTNTVIVLEEVGDFGVIEISGQAEGIEEVKKRIENITYVPQVGDVFEQAKVKNIVSFGAFVEFLPGKEGLLHISEIEWKRLEKVEDALKEGDRVSVKIIGLDPKTGKLKLSRKVLIPRPENANA